MKKSLIILLLIAVLLSVSACYTHTHVVGKGAQSGAEVSKTQWYAIWGLVPINVVNSQEMAAGAENYTVVTQQTFADSIISIITSYITVTRQTVTVKK